MRTFVLFSRALTAPFGLENLSEKGRMDLVCRCVISSMFLSYKMRDDSEIYIVLNGAPNPPVSVHITGKSDIHPDEQSIAAFINEMLSLKITNDWKEHKGSFVSKKSFQDIVREAKGETFVLHEKGEPIQKMKIYGNLVFILGDNRGIPINEEKFALRKAKKISLGKESYLTSACISLLNWICDNGV